MPLVSRGSGKGIKALALSPLLPIDIKLAPLNHKEPGSILILI